MEKRGFITSVKEAWPGLLVAVLIGAAGYGLKAATRAPIADPLLLAMIFGIIFRTAIGDSARLKSGFTVAPAILIPPGIVFYAANNLDFVKFSKVEAGMVALLIMEVLVYFGVILLTGRLLGQKREITYLTATGSAICGASAIVITSSAVKAEPDDISISLLAVTMAALVALFILLPFLAILFDINNWAYGLLSGSILQFTGFVKASVAGMPPLTAVIPAGELLPFALSVKALRYLGLLLAIPLFASMASNKIHIPRILWVFLGAGLIGTWIHSANETFYTETLSPLIKPVYGISWSVAMAAVGLNADARQLLSNNGAKALIMAFAGFSAATITFFVGLFVLQML